MAEKTGTCAELPVPVRCQTAPRRSGALFPCPSQESEQPFSLKWVWDVRIGSAPPTPRRRRTDLGIVRRLQKCSRCRDQSRCQQVRQRFRSASGDVLPRPSLRIGETVRTIIWKSASPLRAAGNRRPQRRNAQAPIPPNDPSTIDPGLAMRIGRNPKPQAPQQARERRPPPPLDQSTAPIVRYFLQNSDEQPKDYSDGPL
jgi:hypothetical protein